MITMRIIHHALWLLLFGCGTMAHAQDETVPLLGVDTWAGRAPSPALVNPAVKSPLQSVLTLRGDWEFVTCETTQHRHPSAKFYKQEWKNARTLQVPGCWEAQGVGSPGLSSPWDCQWDNCAKPLHCIYMGDAWYRKTVTIPDAWRGQRVWLKIGGVRSQGWFWVNETPVAWVDTYCGTYKYDITDLIKPGGTAVIVAEVNNIPPSKKGCFCSTHRFGGIYRDAELEATPDTHIDYAWVRGDYDNKTAEIHTTVSYAGSSSNLAKPILRVSLKTSDGQPAGEGTQSVVFDPKRKTVEVACRIPLTKFQPWSPDSPSLYLAEIVLCDGEKPVHGWVERFGVRKFEVRGDRFFFNNQPFFVRGYGDDFVYPLTLVSPASREEHLKHFKAARKAGFVYVRLHTHCELPEYYEAADEAGMLIQPELPYYHDYPTEAFTYDPQRDLNELITHYRRYTSLATYCMGNEGDLGERMSRDLYQLVKQRDPDRLVLHQDGGPNNTTQNSDFRSGPINVWPPGSFACDAPFIAHEYLNLCVKQDPRLAPKFTGAMAPPVPMETRDEWLKNAGLDRRWGDACQDSAHALQLFYQKQGVEAARMDSRCSGFDFWTIVDVIVKQGNSYSSQGLFNPFWEPKANGYTPEEFGAFNTETVLLLKPEKKDPIVVAGDSIKAEAWISHYGARTLEQCKLTWTLRAGETVLAQGICAGGDVEPGSVKSLAKLDIAVPDLTKPVHAVLEVSLAGKYCNQWDCWLFPKRAIQPVTGIVVSKPLQAKLEKLYSGLLPADDPAAGKAPVLLSCLGSPDVEPALAAGKRIILINRTEGAPNISLGWWWMGNQVGTAFAKHPALGDFPHEGYLSQLSFRIMKNGFKLPAVSGMRPDEMMVVGEGLDCYFLYAGQARCGNGRILITGGLDLLSGFPEGTCILDGLIHYAQSDAFNPTGEIKSLPASE